MDCCRRHHAKRIVFQLFYTSPFHLLLFFFRSCIMTQTYIMDENLFCAEVPLSITFFFIILYIFSSPYYWTSQSSLCILVYFLSTDWLWESKAGGNTILGYLLHIRAYLHYYYCLFCYILSLLFYTLSGASIQACVCAHFLKVYFVFFILYAIKIKSYKSLTNIFTFRAKWGNIFVTCCLTFYFILKLIIILATGR